jgi:hypothetical protein
MKLAETACDKYVQIMMKESGVHEENVSCNVKRFHPGPSLGVGPSLVQGAEEAKADTIIIGSRGLGAVSRSLLRPLGLGSASDFTVRAFYIRRAKPGIPTFLEREIGGRH